MLPTSIQYINPGHEFQTYTCIIEMFMRVLLHALLLSGLCWAQDELLNNPDFEEPFGSDNWVPIGCDLTQTDEDSYRGQYSGLVENR